MLGLHREKGPQMKKVYSRRFRKPNPGRWDPHVTVIGATIPPRWLIRLQLADPASTTIEDE
jgi:hypothetical protein